ncbi:MAG: hypothetical protein IPJ65_07285 [Archangiaceae bacterium]|nr:hypothetical protein [Archangiaceae bacterium]
MKAMTTKEAEANLADVKRNLEQRKRALNGKRIELASVRARVEPLQAELARIKALPEVTTADLLAQTNTERKLAQVWEQEDTQAAQVAAADSDVARAGAEVSAAERALADARLFEFEEALLQRVFEMDRELAASFETLTKLDHASGKGGVITRRFLAGRTSLSPAMAFAASALQFALEAGAIKRSA